MPIDPRPFDPTTYRMTVADKRGMPIRPMTFRLDPPPYRDESLLGIVVRSAARNGFVSLARVSHLADYGVGKVPSLAIVDRNVAERLAYVLKLPLTEVVSRLHRRVATASHGPGDGQYADAAHFVDFFGVPIRKVFRERSRRRTSPRALAVAPYHRALHDLRPFTFCTETMESLLDACPVCRHPFDWIVTRGIQYCPRCVEDGAPTVDLRDYPQPLVDVDPDEARAVSGLVHPDPDVRDGVLRRIDPALRGHSPGDLFQMATMLGFALVTDVDAKADRIALLTKGGQDLFTPSVIAMIGKALLDWKAGFAGIADEMRKDTDRRAGEFGLHKEIGPLRQLRTRRSALPGAVRALVGEAIDEDMRRTAHTTATVRRTTRGLGDDRITLSDAAELLGVSHHLVTKLIRSGGIEAIMPGSRMPALMATADVQAIKDVRDDMVEGTAAARRVGLPLAALEALAAVGRIDKAEGPATLLNHRTVMPIQYRRGSLERYVRGIMAKLTPADATIPCQPFETALRRLPPGDKPWLHLLNAMESGELRIYGTDDGGTSFANVSVSPTELGEAVRLGGPQVRPGPDVPLSYREAAALVGTSEPNITYMVASGLLATTGDGKRRLSRDAIMRYVETYTDTREVSKRLGIAKPMVRRKLAERGIVPVVALHRGHSFVWDRRQVFAHLGDERT